MVSWLLAKYSLFINLSFVCLTLTNSLGQVCKPVFIRGITSTSFDNPILPKAIGLSGVLNTLPTPLPAIPTQGPC